MGFSLEAIVDKVGHKIDKKGSNVTLKPQGLYGRTSKPHVPPEPPPHHLGHSHGYNNLEAFSDEGLLEEGREPRGRNSFPNYHGPEQPSKNRNIFEGNVAPGKENFSPPPAAAEPAFTGGGLLGKMMNSKEGGRSTKSSGEVGQGPRSRYKRERGPPRHEDLYHRGGLHPNDTRKYQREASHSHGMHGSGSRGSKEFGSRVSRGAEKEELQNPFDDRESY